MNPKDLKKLADACRKAGIKTYKDAEVEFTLSDEQYISNYKKSKAKSQPQPQSHASELFESDSLTEGQLLMWSVQGTPGDEQDTQ